MKHIIAALLLSATPALALDLSAMNEVEKAQFGAAVRGYLMENPEVLIEAMNALEQRRLAEESANDAVLLEQYHDDIFAHAADWVGGNPEGDVTLVEFIDYRCGVCRQVFPHVEEVVADDGNLRFIMKELPILGQESDLAARFALAVKQQAGDEAYKDIHDHFFTMRGNITLEGLKTLAQDKGLDADAVLEAMNSEEVSTVLRENAQLANALRVSGTPTFVVGDQLLRGVPQTGLTPAIEQARAADKS